jgi:hypothetical protein
MLLYGGKQMARQVTPTTRISVLRGIISKAFGISVRKRRVSIKDLEAGREERIGEGDGHRDVAWFISGRKGEVAIE